MKIEKYKISFLVTVLSGFISVGMAQAPFSKNYTIWYDKPAEIWEEALSIGNGRLGAMCFGGIHEEKLQLNDVTIWSGEPSLIPIELMRIKNFQRFVKHCEIVTTSWRKY